MRVAESWRSELHLSEATILAVINEVIAQKRDGPPKSLRYFDAAMQDAAAIMNQTSLQPANLNEGHHDTSSYEDRCNAAAAERLDRILDAAVRGRWTSQIHCGCGRGRHEQLLARECR